ncbi:MFS transporter [Amycolatopsis acididurans]|uniref:MFS transporter n=1 Tax=Amycolatopsis acididurans TaxID=2724524 RepID=UPI0028ACA137|nr:MFS transporter [Amycolatopsis acididurans]
MTFVPDLIGGAALSVIADRYSRQTVMVTADLARAALVGAMAIPGLSLIGQIALLIGVQLLAVPFGAARTAALPDILRGDQLTVGIGLISMTYQFALVLGFGAGAAVVTGLGTTGALLVDSATFVVSALVIRLGVGPHQPRARSDAERRFPHSRSIAAGVRLVAHDRRLRVLLGIACLSGFYVVAEGLAVPYSAEIGAGTLGAGWLLAANPLGTVVGMLLLKRIQPERRLALLGPLAVITCALLVPTWWAPGLGLTVVLWGISGAASAHDMITNSAYVQAAPEHVRAQAVGLAVAALRASQGIAIVMAGLLAQVLEPSKVIALAALGGVVAACAATMSWSRAVSPQRAPRGETDESMSG